MKLVTNQGAECQRGAQSQMSNICVIHTTQDSGTWRERRWDECKSQWAERTEAKQYVVGMADSTSKLNWQSTSPFELRARHTVADTVSRSIKK